ncbi:hypothetical protein NQ314_016037 [Rhamnusium bicolor]|uniref:DDE Tnp4 domain-containing protein n=1 Tax=Rhamnusium bicolor TaxID=1586634 RepID=A0AAV8WY00_9CUCU|nr:hypothetical protein NQ314_016037 [Rhamnusium bicolor]
MGWLLFSYRGERTVSKIVDEVCLSLWNHLQPIFLKMPDEQSWKTYENEFGARWQFPKCVGVIDGKHVIIKSPSNSGTSYFSYKKIFSVVLLAIASANSDLITIDVGSSSRFSDGGIFSDSPIGRKLKMNSFHLPKPSKMENYTDGKFPYVVVSLMKNLMWPFPRR